MKLMKNVLAKPGHTYFKSEHFWGNKNIYIFVCVLGGESDTKIGFSSQNIGIINSCSGCEETCGRE